MSIQSEKNQKKKSTMFYVIGSQWLVRAQFNCVHIEKPFFLNSCAAIFLSVCDSHMCLCVRESARAVVARDKEKATCSNALLLRCICVSLCGCETVYINLNVESEKKNQPNT